MYGYHASVRIIQLHIIFELTKTWKGVPKLYAFASRTLLFLFSLGKISGDKLGTERDRRKRRKEVKSPIAALQELPQFVLGFASFLFERSAKL